MAGWLGRPTATNSDQPRLRVSPELLWLSRQRDDEWF
ncbi:hypothetical protein CKAH01_10247 [Colletotrichum kahawae]|uniref:Uncharacterized protein n=1 Tax=Colletotrichum kahawae TaxID=34407 RepID=A0AAE0CXR1_COLKA|nr:hypothetical protein CKAH01_10247 [Colletotrichum kahawae]